TSRSLLPLFFSLWLVCGWLVLLLRGCCCSRCCRALCGDEVAFPSLHTLSAHADATTALRLALRGGARCSSTKVHEWLRRRAAFADSMHELRGSLSNLRVVVVQRGGDYGTGDARGCAVLERRERTRVTAPHAPFARF